MELMREVNRVGGLGQEHCIRACQACGQMSMQAIAWGSSSSTLLDGYSTWWIALPCPDGFFGSKTESVSHFIKAFQQLEAAGYQEWLSSREMLDTALQFAVPVSLPSSVLTWGSKDATPPPKLKESQLTAEALAALGVSGESPSMTRPPRRPTTQPSWQHVLQSRVVAGSLMSGSGEPSGNVERCLVVQFRGPVAGALGPLDDVVEQHIRLLLIDRPANMSAADLRETITRTSGQAFRMAEPVEVPVAFAVAHMGLDQIALRCGANEGVQIALDFLIAVLGRLLPPNTVKESTQALQVPDSESSAAGSAADWVRLLSRPQYRGIRLQAHDLAWLGIRPEKPLAIGPTPTAGPPPGPPPGVAALKVDDKQLNTLYEENGWYRRSAVTIAGHAVLTSALMALSRFQSRMCEFGADEGAASLWKSLHRVLRSVAPRVERDETKESTSATDTGADLVQSLCSHPALVALLHLSKPNSGYFSGEGLWRTLVHERRFWLQLLPTQSQLQRFPLRPTEHEYVSACLQAAAVISGHDSDMEQHWTAAWERSIDEVLHFVTLTRPRLTSAVRDGSLKKNDRAAMSDRQFGYPFVAQLAARLQVAFNGPLAVKRTARSGPTKNTLAKNILLTDDATAAPASETKKKKKKKKNKNSPSADEKSSQPVEAEASDNDVDEDDDEDDESGFSPGQNPQLMQLYAEALHQITVAQKSVDRLASVSGAVADIALKPAVRLSYVLRLPMREFCEPGGLNHRRFGRASLPAKQINTVARLHTNCLPRGVCAVCCALQGLKRCSRCNVVAYCSVDHQKSHWKTHKADCVPKAKKK